MKYIIPALAALLLSACGGDSNPFAPVIEPAQDSLSTPVAAADPVSEPIAQPEPVVAPEPVDAPVVQPEPVNTPEPVSEPVTPVETVEQVVAEPEPVPVVEQSTTPESEIEGLWHCKQFGEDFTWNLKPDRTIVQNNPGVFEGVIGTYWHLQDETFALGYTSGGIAEFTCDGETMNAGAMVCSRTPIVDD